jgi:hypothetical protein
MAFSADRGILNNADRAFALVLCGEIALPDLMKRFRLEIPLPGLRGPGEQK